MQELPIDCRALLVAWWLIFVILDQGNTCILGKMIRGGYYRQEAREERDTHVAFSVCSYAWPGEEAQGLCSFRAVFRGARLRGG